MLGKLIGTGTLFAPPQLADFDSTRFKSPALTLTAAVSPAARTPTGQLRDIATSYAKAMYAQAPAPRLADACTARENGVSSVLNKTLKPLAASKPPFHPFQLSCAQSVNDGFFAMTGSLREARILAADESQGLVLMATTVDHAGDVAMVTLGNGSTVAVPEAFRAPSSYQRSTLVKVRDGRIEHAETITRPVFLGLDDGWRD
jgi:hypothetical protein